MADNIQVSQGTGTTMATDDVSGVQYPRVKISHGADGSATDASSASPFPVSDSASQTKLDSIITELGQKVEASDLAGLATSAKQDLLLAELQNKADLTDTQPVSLAAVPLATGAATSALQTTANTKLDSLIAKDFSTSAKQDALLSELQNKADLTDTQPVAPNITRGSGAVDSNTQRVTMATDDLVVTELQSIDNKLPALVSGAMPSLQRVVDSNGNVISQQATENGATNVGNAYKKFRDGFADLSQDAQPDSAIWDVAWVNQGSSSIGRAGNAQGASYMKISMCPITAGSEVQLTTKRSFKYPMRFINMLSLSQRPIGQEFEVSLVGVDNAGVVTTLTPKADLTISGTVSITSNVATINFATAHGLQTGDRVILIGNTERRLNVGPVTVTVTNALSITVPCTLANAAYTAGGVVRWADPLAYAKNGAGLLHENATVTNATFMTRRNGFNTRLLNSTIVTTANAANVTMADPFNATSMNQIIANQEEFTIIPRSPDSAVTTSNPLKWHQGLPDEELEYKVRIRAKNLDNITRPIARITAISKTGTTTATVTTDVAHGLATTDFVQIYGVRDATNFPNLTAQTQVASIVSSTQFTIVIGAAVTASSAGGTVFINQGSVLAPGVASTINVQSISRTNNILALVGNGTWTAYLPGETVHLYGCDATSMGLYDGSYKVLRINTTTLELESVGADFTTINCGGIVIRRTDFRIHAVSQIEHTRHIVELSNAQGSNDNTKALPVLATGGAISINAGGNVIGIVATSTPSAVADITSAALTSTTTSSVVTPASGTAYQVNIPVTAVTGTNPTLDVAIEESTDSGTNWFKVYDFPRITATGFYNSPILRLRGTRVRYVQTVTGTTPSFTRSLNRLQISHAASQNVQMIDRTIVPNTLNSVTPTLLVEGCQDFNFLVRCTAQTTAATFTPQFSMDGTNWHSHATTLTTVVGFAHYKVQNEQWKFARMQVTAAGTGITLDTAEIRAMGQ